MAEARGSTRAQVSDAVVEDFAGRHEQARRLQKLQTLWGLLWHRVAAENGAVHKATMACVVRKNAVGGHWPWATVGTFRTLVVHFFYVLMLLGSMRSV